MTRYTAEELKELCDRSVANETQLRLDDADCSNLILPKFNFAGARLSGASFSGSNLSMANFSGAALRDVNFYNAKLAGANFADAALEYASLHSAYCRSADFSYAACNGVDFTDADMRNTVITGTTLANANLIVLTLPQWTVYVHSDSIRIGCQHHTHAEWDNFSEEQIEVMAVRATDWWTIFKPVIMAAAARVSSYKC
jgi:uncharacterized protein YjbI with pentapeptide repeats